MNVKRHISLLLVFLLLVATSALNAQSKKASRKGGDKYRKSSYSPKVSTTKDEISVEESLELGNRYLNKDPKKALFHFDKALTTAISNDDKDGQALSYSSLGILTYNLKEYEISISHLTNAIDLLRADQNNGAYYQSVKYLGLAYHANEDFDMALENYFTFLEKAKAVGNEEDELFAQNVIAEVYYKLKKYDLAISRYEKVVEIEEQKGNKRGVAVANGNIGQIYLERNDASNAKTYFDNKTQIAQEIDDVTLYNSSLDDISKVYSAQDNKEEEIKLRKQSLESNVSLNNVEELKTQYLELGNLYIEQDNALEAIPNLKQSIEFSNKLGKETDLDILLVKKEALKGLSEAYKEIGETDKALQVYEQYIQVVDSIKQEEENQLLAKSELNNDLNEQRRRVSYLQDARKKDKELQAKKFDILEKDRQLKAEQLTTQKLLTYAMAGGMLLLLVVIFLVNKSSKQKKISNQLLALKSLRSQMNPHFIFNALNSVNSFISKNDERSANKYLSDFSRLMRSVLENSQKDFVTLDAELRILELYLSLEHFRFRDKFDYEMIVSEGINTELFEIPPMLIQPYIENAVWHGLRYKEEKGFLKLGVFQKGDSLVVEVRDNGIGRKRSQEIKTKNQKENESTGLKNIESRLAILNEMYKTQLQVSIEDLDPTAKDSGTIVRIEVPLKINEDE